jgi:hypothetical protein
MRAADDQGESIFFNAERTGVVSSLHWHVRTGDGYSLGNGGTYTIQIRPADPVTKRPIQGSAPICQLTGYQPGNAGGSHEYPEITFATTGQIVVGQPYCIVVRNTHANPGGNFVSQNNNVQAGFDSTSQPANYVLPGGGPMSGIVVASGGIEPDQLGASPAIVKGWTPIRINGTNWTPYPIMTEDGIIRHQRIGPAFAELVYQDGTVTNWGSWGSETDYRATINGNNQFRERFRVTRASRTVSGVFIRSARAGDGGGNVLVRLETGPEVDTHAAGNGTLIEEVSVAASLFLNVAGFERTNEVLANPPSDPLELVHWVWVPFAQNRTLTLGQTYNLRLVPSGCNLRMWCSGRADGTPGFGPAGSSSIWSAWAANREVSWNAFEDSRGCQVSTNGGSSWAYGPGGAKLSPILFRCV